MSLPDPTKTDGKNIARIGDRLVVSGCMWGKYTTASPTYTQANGYYAPIVMWSEKDTYGREYRVLWEYKFRTPKQVVYTGWTYLYTGEHHPDYGGEGCLTDRESILVLTVMPDSPSQRYRKLFHVLPSQVVSKVMVDK